MNSSLRRLAALLALSTGLAGCAALRAPVAFEPVDVQPRQQSDAQLRVEPVEGRPGGLVLRFACACDPPENVWLELLRRAGDEQAQVYRSIRLDEELRAKLSGDGIEFFDRSVAPATMHYQLRLRASRNNRPADTLMVSAPTVVDWRRPPERPRSLRVDSAIAGVVELHWEAPPGSGALVFRRNVLAEDRPRRVALLGASSGGVFVDRDLERGGVYAYRVALALDTGATLQFGQPSGEIYVTVRAAPAAIRQGESGI